MSLITRCPACGTMFKVVTDQLKVSQGWVRCGHCSEVFDASLHLQADQPAQEPRKPQEAPAAPPSQPESPAPAPLPLSAPEWSPGGFLADRPLLRPSADGFVAHSEASHSAFDPAEWKRRQALPPKGAQTLPANAQGALAQTATQQAADAVRVSTSIPTDDPDSELPQDAPDEARDVSFVRDARRQAFWRKPAVRMALGLLILLLAAALMLQALIQHKDRVAALEPRLKPWLQVLCEQLHCVVQPLRHIESLVIDSSSFNKIDVDAYRLSFSLKNTGPAAVAMPALEITLTDTQDQALVRRVLTPVQFGASGLVLAAGADFSGMVVMQLSGADAPGAAAALRVAGYRVLAFYP